MLTFGCEFQEQYHYNMFLNKGQGVMISFFQQVLGSNQLQQG